MRSLQTRNRTLVEKVASLNKAKTQNAELISQLPKKAAELKRADSPVASRNDRLKDLIDHSQERVDELEVANKSLVFDNEKLQLDLNCLKRVGNERDLAVFERLLQNQVINLTPTNQRLTTQLAALSHSAVVASGGLIS